MPVWINVRRDPVPNLARLDEVLLGGRLDASRHITNLFSLGFFLRSVVLNPEGDTILNWQPTSVFGTGMYLWTHGAFSYAQAQPNDYRKMLAQAL